MNPTDETIIKALHAIVPEPPETPSRLASVRRRATLRRRRQLAAGSLVVVGAVATGVAFANAGGPSSAPSVPAGPVKPATINGLPATLYRPLHLPTVAAGAACPVTASRTYPAGGGFNSTFEGLGNGPVALTSGSPIPVNFTNPTNDLYTGTGWPGMKVIWRISPDYQGPVLMRGQRLDAPGELRFDHYLDAVGSSSGSDGSPDAKAYPDLGYAASPGVKSTRTPPDAIRVKAPGCYGIQVDGTNFSEIITFRVVSTG